MARMIDASAMRDDWLENGENEYVYDTNAVLDSIDAQPTIDAVPVSKLEELRDYLYSEDLIFMRGLAELNKLIANCGATMDEKE